MKKFEFFVFTLILFFALNACAFFSEEENVVFSLPCEFNGQTVESFLILYADGIHQNTLSSAEKVSPAQKITLTLSKNSTAAILAYPIIDGKKEKPLGCIYPYSNEIQTENGFSASILYTLYLSSSDNPKQLQDYLARFNWERFMDCISEIQDPWQLDTERILQKIASGKFKKNDLKLKPN